MTPDNAKFFWGAATSAHQVEGGNHNDWTEWEKRTAKSKAQIAKSNPPADGWPDYILKNYPSPLQEENYISGKACDHYNRFREDFDIAKQLGHNAHRFSVEWSRVEPEEGKWNEKEIEHYRQVIRALKERGLEPFVTLWHWPLPIWLRDKDGWKSKKIVDYFCRYAEKVVSELRHDVTFWLTVNEPLAYAGISYLEGRWPPQEKNLISFFRVSRNLIHAHKKAYGAIKRINPKSQIGIANNMSFFEATKNNIFSNILKRLGEWGKNYAFLNAISDCQDFIGFNYYFTNQANLRFSKVKTDQTTDTGWSMYPKGIYSMLCALKKYHKPIYITENGLADARDIHRAEFMREHVKWMKKAMAEGVDVRGYFYWSLLDNFEWSDGFWPRFGLVEIDYKTMERKIRPSAWEYARLIANSEEQRAEGIGPITKR